MTKEKSVLLLASLFILSACAILYELLISTVSTYLLGSSVLHFSVTIGLFLSFLGVGSWLSKFIDEPLLDWFIGLELILGLVGGVSALILYLGNAYFDAYYGLLLITTAAVGTLAGIEIPILTRLLEKTDALRSLIAHVLTFDYLGALVASLAFPLLLLPFFGTMRTAFLVGLINWSVAIFNLYFFKNDVKNGRKLQILSLFVGLSLIFGFIFSLKLTQLTDNLAYQDKIIITQQTPYQRLVVTAWHDDVRLFLNGNLQFSSVDEYRYHEALCFIPMLIAPKDSMRVLILGGGDGLAARDVWRVDSFLQKNGTGSVAHLDLVDLDKAVVDLARENAHFTRLNRGSLQNSKLTCHFQDAFTFIEKGASRYDVVIVDLPDPSEPALGKLYSREFYGLLSKRLAADGVVVTQSTSPFFAREPFWCIHHTLRAVFPAVVPYHAHVPSFGDWGFNLAFPTASARFYPDSVAQRLSFALKNTVNNDGRNLNCRFLTPQNVFSMFNFDKDTEGVGVYPVNTLHDMPLVRLYEASFRRFH